MCNQQQAMPKARSVNGLESFVRLGSCVLLGWGHSEIGARGPTSRPQSRCMWTLLMLTEYSSDVGLCVPRSARRGARRRSRSLPRSRERGAVGCRLSGSLVASKAALEVTRVTHGPAGMPVNLRALLLNNCYTVGASGCPEKFCLLSMAASTFAWIMGNPCIPCFHGL